MGTMISWLMAIFGGVVVTLIVSEIGASVTVVANWLIRIAASRLPNEQRAGVQAEWLSHLNEEPTALRKMLHAVGCLWSASGVAKELNNYPKLTRRPPKTEPTDSFWLSLIATRRIQTRAALEKSYWEWSKRLDNDPKAADIFVALNEAHEILSDPKKLSAFDQCEIDAEGKSVRIPTSEVLAWLKRDVGDEPER
jgi:hypothetical protein